MLGVGLGLTSIATRRRGATLWQALDALLSPGAVRLEILWPAPQFWFSDAAGLVPWVSGPVRGWRSTAGTLFSQPTNADFAPGAGAFRNGNAALSLDGVDDWLQSAAALDLSGSDGLVVMAGLRRLAAGVPRVIAELGTSSNTHGGWYLVFENSDNFRASYSGRGARFGQAGDTANAINLGGTNLTTVLTAQQALQSGAPATIRRDGVLAGTSANTSFGTGNFAAGQRLNIGARNSGAPGTVSLWLHALLGPLVIRSGALPDAATIAASEAIINQHVGAY